MAVALRSLPTPPYNWNRRSRKECWLSPGSAADSRLWRGHRHARWRVMRSIEKSELRGGEDICAPLHSDSILKKFLRMAGICLIDSFRTGIQTTSLAIIGQHQTDRTAINAGQETESQEKSRQNDPFRRSTDISVPSCAGWEQWSTGITGRGVSPLHDYP